MVMIRGRETLEVPSTFSLPGNPRIGLSFSRPSHEDAHPSDDGGRYLFCVNGFSPTVSMGKYEVRFDLEPSGLCPCDRDCQIGGDLEWKGLIVEFRRNRLSIFTDGANVLLKNDKMIGETEWSCVPMQWNNAT